MSCVENQVLEYLRTRGEPFEELYADAAVPLRELYAYFIEQGGSPAYYQGIPRVQDVAAARGLLGIERRREPSAARVRNQLRDEGDACTLVRVTAAFTRTQLHARGWRDDHFVRAAAREDGVRLVSDVPPVAVELDADGFDEAYDGETIRVMPLRPITEEDRRWLWERRRYRPEGQRPEPFRPQSVQDTPALGTRLRDLAGTYRTLRRRLQAYYRAYVDTAFIADQLPRIDGLYARLEYGNLRGREAAWFAALWDELAAIDDALMTALTQRLEAAPCSDGE